MPKHLVFAACEKVIISQDENNATLISLLSEIGGSIEMKEQPEGLFSAPLRWHVFTMWGKDPRDGEKAFEQTVRFMSPSGKNVFATAPESTDIEFKGRTHRVNATITTLPVGENGAWMLQLFLREKGTDWPAEPICTYPLYLNFTIDVKKSTTPSKTKATKR